MHIVLHIFSSRPVLDQNRTQWSMWSDNSIYLNLASECRIKSGWCQIWQIRTRNVMRASWSLAFDEVNPSLKLCVCKMTWKSRQIPVLKTLRQVLLLPLTNIIIIIFVASESWNGWSHTPSTSKRPRSAFQVPRGLKLVCLKARRCRGVIS